MKQGWEIKKLGEVCEILDHLRVPITKKDRREGCYPYYGASGVQDYIDSYIFDGRYLLVGEDGAKWGPNDKSAYIIEGKSWVNNHAHILKINECLSDKLVEYYLVAKDLQEFITGAIVPKLTQQALKNIPIPVLPLPIQERIVSELDLLSGIIEKKREQLKELDALAQSIFYDMFGDPITNEKGWEVKKLGEVCKTTSGGTPSKGQSNYYDGGTIPWLRSGEVNKMYIYDTELFITEEGLENSSAKWFPEDTVVIAMYGATVGQVGILRNSMTTNQAICGVFPNETFIPIYLFHFLQSNKEEYIKMASGGAQPNISQNIIRETVIPIPPLPLQHQFATKIEAIEKQKELIKQSISETETLFNERMQHYFS